MTLIVRIVGVSGPERYLCDDGWTRERTLKKFAAQYATPDLAWQAAIEYAKTHDNIAVSVIDTQNVEREVSE